MHFKAVKAIGELNKYKMPSREEILIEFESSFDFFLKNVHPPAI